jgi:hypothetical protein
MAVGQSMIVTYVYLPASHSVILFASLNAAKIAAMSGPTRVLLIDGWAITDGMSITDGMAITDDMSITDGMAIIESMSIPRVSSVPLPSWFIWLLTCGIWLETCGVWFETCGVWLETCAIWLETCGVWLLICASCDPPWICLSRTAAEMATINVAKIFMFESFLYFN